MPELLASFSRLLDWRSLVDVTLVAVFIFILLRLFRGTAATQLLRGVLLVTLVVAALSQVVDLPAFNWLLRNSIPMVLVAIPVIFQPELRRALERLGRSSPLFARRGDSAGAQNLIAEVVKTVDFLSQRQHGELLATIFFPNTPLHDGAVVVRGDRVVAAGCILPLTDRDLMDSQLGTRHRAAVGISEQSDALVVVVSEETGKISVARNGRIVKLDTNRLRAVLSDFYSMAN
jgi:diadenylate cyclase